MKKITVITVLCLSATAYAQDIHWSQPSTTLLYQNPAFTGVYGRMSINANYRSQWNAVNTPYNSALLSGDYCFSKAESENVAISVGGLAYNDVAGDGNYRTTGGGITTSCFVKAGKTVRLGAGLGYSLVQNSLQLDKFSWGSQFDGQNYNPVLSSGEGQGTLTRMVSDLNAGVAVHLDQNGGSSLSRSNTRWIFGYSISHLNRANIGLNGISDKLRMKHTLLISGTSDISDIYAIKPIALFYRQGTLMEITAGALLRITIGQQSRITGYKKASAFSLGALYRVKDAIIPTMEFEKGSLLFGLSYDMNVSSMTTASKLRGGIEFSIRYIDFSKYLYKDTYKDKNTKTGTPSF